MLSFQILSLSNYAYVNIVSPPFIMTPLWFSMCKPMNSLEVSRITVFCNDNCKNFLGEDPPPSIQLRQDIGRKGTIKRMQATTCALLFYIQRNAPPAYIASGVARRRKVGGTNFFTKK